MEFSKVFEVIVGSGIVMWMIDKFIYFLSRFNYYRYTIEDLKDLINQILENNNKEINCCKIILKRDSPKEEKCLFNFTIRIEFDKYKNNRANYERIAIFNKTNFMEKLFLDIENIIELNTKIKEIVEIEPTVKNYQKLENTVKYLKYYNTRILFSKYALYKNTLNRNTKILIMVLWPQIEITELYKKNLKKNNLEKDIQDVLQQDILKNIKEY